MRPCNAYCPLRQLNDGHCPPCNVCPYKTLMGRCARPDRECPHCVWLRDRIHEGEVLPVKRRRESAPARGRVPGTR